MTREEYFKQVQAAWANVDKKDRDAVHEFNVWREELLRQVDKKNA